MHLMQFMEHICVKHLMRRVFGGRRRKFLRDDDVLIIPSSLDSQVIWYWGWGMEYLTELLNKYTLAMRSLIWLSISTTGHGAGTNDGVISIAGHLVGCLGLNRSYVGGHCTVRYYWFFACH